MTGFRDMTFCPFWQDCAAASTCGRPLTPQIKTAATRWWGSADAPIAVFTDQPECHTKEPQR